MAVAGTVSGNKLLGGERMDVVVTELLRAVDVSPRSGQGVTCLCVEPFWYSLKYHLRRYNGVVGFLAYFHLQ
jgi:hypothetical protein